MYYTNLSLDKALIANSSSKSRSQLAGPGPEPVGPGPGLAWEWTKPWGLVRGPEKIAWTWTEPDHGKAPTI